MIYTIRIAEAAVKMLADIQDRRIRGVLSKRIDNLANEPENQGSSLSGILTGYRSVRAVGQRYRIVYRIDDGALVIVGALGIRRDGDRHDVYAIAQRLAIGGFL